MTRPRGIVMRNPAVRRVGYYRSGGSRPCLFQKTYWTYAHP